MNSKLQAKYLAMAAATLGLALGSGCAKKSEGEAAEGGEAASGAESSCGAGSCGAAHESESKKLDGESAAESGSTTQGTADNDATEQVGGDK